MKKNIIVLSSVFIFAEACWSDVDCSGNLDGRTVCDRDQNTCTAAVVVVAPVIIDDSTTVYGRAWAVAPGPFGAGPGWGVGAPGRWGARGVARRR